MLELNSSNSLWRSRDASAAAALALGQAAPDGLNADFDDPPDQPICCWNICTGILARTDTVHSRQKRSKA